MKLQKMLALAFLIASPLCLSMAMMAAPKIDLIIIGLLNLGFFFAGAITLVGVLSILAGIFFLIGNQSQGTLLLA